MSRSVCQRCGASFQGVGCHLCGDTLLTHAPKDPLLGKIFAGRYRILRKLGQGGMGAVYLAEQVGIGHRVALKLLNANLAGNEEITQRFLNEAKSYARIAHPHAVAFHEFGQDTDGNLFISTEYIEGPDLKNYLVERGRLPAEEAVEIVLQIADALEHAHQSGVIHRDLKPENVIVRQGMRGIHAKVLDFGIARLLEEGTARLTAAGSIAGTPQYMSPEQVRGQDVDARADVYVIGILLFELLTGVQPFAAPTIPEMLYRQVHDPVPPLSKYVADLDAFDRLIQRATSKDPAGRQPSMAAFAADVLAAARDLPSGGRPLGDTSVGLPVPSAYQRSAAAEGSQGTLLHGQVPGPAKVSETLLNEGAPQDPGSGSHADTILNAQGLPPEGAPSQTSLGVGVGGDAVAVAGVGKTGTLLHAGGLGSPEKVETSAGADEADEELDPTATLVRYRTGEHLAPAKDAGPAGLRGGSGLDDEGWSEPPSRRERETQSSRSPLASVAIGLIAIAAAAGGAYAVQPSWFDGLLGHAPTSEIVSGAEPQSPVDAGPAGAVPAAAAASKEGTTPPARQPAVSDDQRLRQELLATEIWLKANAEFLSGNLQSASEILDTVPDEPTTAERVATLRQNIEEVTTRLARGRSAASRGDCATAIANYSQILSRFPGIREAARGQQDCKRMLPPTLAE